MFKGELMTQANGRFNSFVKHLRFFTSNFAEKRLKGRILTKKKKTAAPNTPSVQMKS